MFRALPGVTNALVKTGLATVGVITILLAGLAALREIDIKKIVALSTLSQLGVIIFTLAIGGIKAGYFHILSHAFFKALLFITIGALIHNVGSFQDLSKSSLLPRGLPLTLAFSLAANLRLCGLPFISGFYSKDLCIELRTTICYSSSLELGLYFATGLTASYTARLIYLVLFPYRKATPSNWVREQDPYINLSIVLLFIASTAGRGALIWLVFTYPLHPNLAVRTKGLTLAVIIVGLLLVLNYPPRLKKLSPQELRLLNIWGLPLITPRVPTLPALSTAAPLRAYGDLLWVPEITLRRVPNRRNRRAWSIIRSLTNSPFTSLSIIVLTLFRILLYLYVINFFIIFKIKA